VLDVGCGDGHLAALLEGRCARYVGIDVSPKVIEAAARRVLGSAEGSLVAQQVRFEVGDMHALPLGDASVDVALLLHVLGYSTSPSWRCARLRACCVPAAGWWWPPCWSIPTPS
jgi:ubiquinone/menaquinone biosynthesis C-methylase UbiE